MVKSQMQFYRVDRPPVDTDRSVKEQLELTADALKLISKRSLKKQNKFLLFLFLMIDK